MPQSTPGRGPRSRRRGARAGRQRSADDAVASSQGVDEGAPRSAGESADPAGATLPLESEPVDVEPNRTEPETSRKRWSPKQRVLAEGPSPGRRATPGRRPRRRMTGAPPESGGRRGDDARGTASRPSFAGHRLVAPMPAQARLAAWPTARPPAALPRRCAGALRESEPAPSVAPVVATLPPDGNGPAAGARRSRRLSADSKLLAAGGALAAAMLLVAVGVLLGQRSAEPGAASAAATGSYPLVVETKAPGGDRASAPAARPVETRPAIAEHAAADGSTRPATIDVQQLPARRAPPRTQGWSVAARGAKARPAPAGRWRSRVRPRPQRPRTPPAAASPARREHRPTATRPRPPAPRRDAPSACGERSAARRSVRPGGARRHS